MATRMQQRRGTAAQWISTNSGQGPVLNAGEIGFEIDNNRFKIGDGVNHWVDLPYFANNEAITDLIDGAPALLDTLNELAAAVGDDPAFFTTVATNLSNHQSDTTNIHGIADTALLATKAYADNAVSAAVGTLVDSAPDLLNTLNEIAAAIGDDPAFITTVAGQLSNHQTDTTNIHGIPDTAELETKTGSAATADAAVLAHNLDTTNVHGIADTSALETQTGAQSKADTAVSTHNADTTNVHGIADTSALALTATVTTDIAAAVTAHNNDTTNVHGIADTSVLETQSGSQSKADTAVSTHNLDTTGVHGIADTSELETQSGAEAKAAAAVSAHNLETTNVHGILDTADLATQDYVLDQIAASTGEYPELAGEGLDWNAVTLAFDIDSTVATQTDLSTAISDHNLVTTNVHGIDDTAELATVTDVSTAQSDAENHADTAVSTHNADTTDVHGILDTAALATKQYASNLLLNATKTNITITGDQNGLTISAENGVADSDTDFLTEGTNNLYFTTERAQDAVGNSVGTGLSYNDSTGVVSVDTSVMQARVTNITDTEIGYLDGLSSNIQTQIDTKAALVSPTFTGTVSGITKSMVGLGNVDNTSDANKPVSTAQASAIATAKSEAIADATAQISAVIDGAPAALDTLNELAAAINDDASYAATITASLATKAPLESPTFTGTVSGITKSMVGLANVDNTSDANKPVSSATQTALDAKLSSSTAASTYAPLVSPTFTGTVTLPTGTVTSGMILDGTITNADINGSAAIALSKLATDPLARANHTGTQTASTISDFNEAAQDAVGTILGSGLTYTDASNTITVDPTVIQLRVANISDTEIGYLDGVTSAIQTQINTKSPSANPTFTGTVVLPSTTSIGTVSATEIGYVDGVTSAIQTQIDAKAPIASPTFTGTVAGITKSMVGLGNVDNTSDANKPVSSATQTALDAKASLAGATFTGSVEIDQNLVVDGNLTVNGTTFNASSTSITIEDNLVQLAHQNAGNTVDLGLVVGYNDGAAKHSGIVRDVSADKWKLFKGVTTEPTTTVDFTQGSLDDLEVAGLTASSLTVGSVSNTEIGYLDGVTSAIQTQLNSKLASATAATTYAPIASPTFTGTVAGITKSMVGLGNVDNTSDAAKPVSTATQTALDLKAPLASPTLTGTPLSTTAVADTNTTQIATTAYVVGQAASATPVMNGTAAVGTSLKYARADHVHASDTAKANLAGPTFTGTVTLPSTTSIGTVSSTEIGYLDGVTSAVQTQLDAKLASATAATTYAPLASPTFTGTVTLPTGTVTSGMILDGTIVNDDISATAAIAQSKISGLSTSLGLKADLASPTFTGVPLAPTAAAGTNTTQVATTAFVGTAVADLVASAPSALNTLNELATALGNDASFSTTVTNSLAAKAPLASPTFTGTATIPTLTLTNPLTAANGGTGLSSLGTGVATFLGTPSSANFASMLTDEIGTGSVVLSEIATSSQTASYTLVAADRGKLVEMNVGSANNLTVPLNSSVAFPVGTQIDILQVGSGQTTIVATGGVTINGTPGLKIRAQWGGATLIKRATDTWVLIGDLTS